MFCVGRLPNTHKLIMGYFLPNSIPSSIAHTWHDFRGGFFHCAHLITDVLAHCLYWEKKAAAQKRHYALCRSKAEFACFVSCSVSDLYRDVKFFVPQSKSLEMRGVLIWNLLQTFLFTYGNSQFFFSGVPNEQAPNSMYCSN